jgi:hypothetical protein
MRSLAAGIVVSVSLLAGFSSPAGAQRRNPADQVATTEEANLTVEGTIAGQSYKASGSGECKHAPEASIYGVPAALWMVQYAGPEAAALKQLNLTLWQPKNGAPDQVSLSVETKSGSHRINVGGAGTKTGKGSVTIQPSGPGGKVEVKGEDGSGKAIKMTIHCPAFAGVEAEGG